MISGTPGTLIPKLFRISVARADQRSLADCARSQAGCPLAIFDQTTGADLILTRQSWRRTRRTFTARAADAAAGVAAAAAAAAVESALDEHDRDTSGTGLPLAPKKRRSRHALRIVLMILTPEDG
jgi:hypothetical protein